MCHVESDVFMTQKENDEEEKMGLCAVCNQIKFPTCAEIIIPFA